MVTLAPVIPEIVLPTNNHNIEGAKAKNLDESTPQFKMILDNLTDNAQKTTSFQLNEYAWGFVQMIKNETL